MLRQLIIPGIIAATLHGGLLLIPAKPPPPPPPGTETKPFDEPPPLPKVPVVIETSTDRQQDTDNKPPAPANPLPPSLDPTIRPQIDTPDISELIVFNTSDIKTAMIVWQVPPGPPGEELGTPDGKGVGGLIDYTLLDKQPRTLFQAKPDYPHALKNAGITGTVTVLFMVDENGYVHDARVIETTESGFNDAALRAVSRWRFEPGRHLGRRVAFKMSVPFQFTLNDHD